MPRKLDGTFIESGTITITQLSGSVNETSNAAYGQANLAYDQANTAYGQANAARSDANTTFGTINTTFGTVNTSIGNAYGQANLAYAAANNSNLKSGGLVSGTLNVSQDLIVGGNIYLEGNTTYINVATYSVEDSLIYLASNNDLTDSVDIGFMGGKNTSGTYSHTGLARDATDGKWKLFDGLPEEDHVGNVINFANSYPATLSANVEANTLSVVDGVSGNVNFDSGTLFVDSVNNRVGVGTDTPAYSLQVRRAGGAGSLGISIDGVGSTDRAVQYFAIQDSAAGVGAGHAFYYRAPSSTTDTLGLLLTEGGNIGVGTTNPQGQLTVSNGGASGLELYHSGAIGSGPYIQAYNRSTSAYMHLTNYAASHTWYVSGTRAIDLDSSGRVGIGTSSPTSKLHVVNGRTDLTGENETYALGVRYGSSAGIYYIGASNSATPDMIFSQVGGAERMRLTNGGNLGVGNTAPGSKLTVAGTIESTTGGVKFPDGTTQTTAASAAADPIPSGTTMLFVQTSAPTGWTKGTTHNDKALRVVSGSVSTGGTVGFTTAFASKSVAGSISSTTQGGSVSTSVSGSVSGSVGSTTLSTSEMPSHGHSVTDNGVGVTVYDSSVAGGGPYGTVARAATQSAGAGLTINSTGGGGSHNHSWSGSFSGSASSTFTGSSHGHTFTGTAIDLAVQYVDVIIATKN